MTADDALATIAAARRAFEAEADRVEAELVERHRAAMRKRAGLPPMRVNGLALVRPRPTVIGRG